MTQFVQSAAAPDAIHYDYDEDVDILYIAFAPGAQATTAVELNDNILLRFNLAERRAVGITLMDFSVLTQVTPLGPRQFPLTGLQDLDAEWQEMVLDLIAAPPVSYFLTMSALSPSSGAPIPIVAVENPLVAVS